jgi:hypothetical protein
VQKELLASPMMVNRFINAKGDVAMVVLQLDSLTVVEDNMKVIMSDIEEAASPYPGKENIHIGGTDVINEGLNKLSERDFGLFTGLAFLLMFLITGIVYRNLLYLLLVLLISVSTVWISLAVHGMLGYRIHIFSIVAPPLVITLSIIGVLHIVNAFENALQQNEASRSPFLVSKGGASDSIQASIVRYPYNGYWFCFFAYIAYSRAKGIRHPFMHWRVALVLIFLSFQQPHFAHASDTVIMRESNMQATALAYSQGTS